VEIKLRCYFYIDGKFIGKIIRKHG